MGWAVLLDKRCLKRFFIGTAVLKIEYKNCVMQFQKTWRKPVRDEAQIRKTQ